MSRKELKTVAFGLIGSALILACFYAEAIRRGYEQDWQPLTLLCNAGIPLIVFWILVATAIVLIRSNANPK